MTLVELYKTVKSGVVRILVEPSNVEALLQDPRFSKTNQGSAKNNSDLDQSIKKKKEKVVDE